MTRKILMTKSTTGYVAGHLQTFKEGSIYDVEDDIYKPFVIRRKVAILYKEKKAKEPEKKKTVVPENKAIKTVSENKKVSSSDKKKKYNKYSKK